MKTLRTTLWSTFFAMLLAAGPALADKYDEALQTFKSEKESAAFFSKSAGYALFPTIGKAGLGVGGAYGEGRVYEKGKHIGDTKMTQVSIGLQAGGQGYSQIIFFEDERAFKEFTTGQFEFGAQAQAVAITAGATAQATTGGTGAGKNVGGDKAQVKGGYQKGMAVFTLAKGGLMYEASIGGQKFNYAPKGEDKDKAKN